MGTDVPPSDLAFNAGNAARRPLRLVRLDLYALIQRVFDKGSASTKDDPPHEERVSEAALRGGLLSAATLVGGTVRRQTGPWTLAVHDVLRHLERVGFAGAPRVVGFDEMGREILSFIDGACPWPMEIRTNDQTLESVAALLRRFHEAMASYSAAPNAVWYEPGVGLPYTGSFVCHGDVAPQNVVFRGEEAVAFIDWDLAGPRERLFDVAYAAWFFVPLYRDDPAIAFNGWKASPPRERRLPLFCAAYGLEPDERDRFLDILVLVQESAWRTMELRGRAGEPGWRDLYDRGMVEELRKDVEFSHSQHDQWRNALKRM